MSRFTQADGVRYSRGNLVSTNATSVARLYPQGVALITAGRPELASIAVQNLESVNTVQFWHGLIPIDPLDPGAGTLPEDPTGWTGGEINTAETVISTYGETLKAGQYLEPFLTPTQQVYSYVAAGTVRAHVKEG